MNRHTRAFMSCIEILTARISAHNSTCAVLAQCCTHLEHAFEPLDIQAHGILAHICLPAGPAWQHLGPWPGWLLLQCPGLMTLNRIDSEAGQGTVDIAAARTRSTADAVLKPQDPGADCWARHASVLHQGQASLSPAPAPGTPQCCTLAKQA